MNIDRPNLSQDHLLNQNDNLEMSGENGSKAQGRWDEDQHQRFLEGLFKFGKNWKQIENFVSTRICSQVRSHAQKYFIKLQKIIKDRKKQKNKLSVQLTELEKEILERFTLDDVTEKTPEILVNLLQNNCLVACPKTIEKERVINGQQNQVNQKGFKKVGKRKQYGLQQTNSGKKPKNYSENKHENAQPNKVQSIIEQCNDQYEQKSFFCRLMENNAEHFRQGRDFTDFIDFVGKHHQEIVQNKPQQLQSSQVSRNRRSSFTLVQDQQNDQRLKEVIQKLTKGQF